MYQELVFIDESFSVPSNIKSFISILRTNEQNIGILAALLGELLRKREYVVCSKNDISYWLEPMEKIANQYISKLSDHGIYNVTIDDFVYNNSGLIKLKEIGQNTFNGMKEILSLAISEWMEGHQNALDDAQSKVTGLSFSVLTSSLLSALVYSSMEASKIKKQEELAQKEYKKALNELNKSTDNNQERRKKELLLKYYYPETKIALEEIINQMSTLYICELTENEVLDYSLVEKYDLNRSTALLKNLNVVGDKKALLKEAFKCCPYNPEVYCKAIEYGYFNDDTWATAQYMDQKDSIVNFIYNNLSYIKYPDKPTVAMQKQSTYISALVMAKNINVGTIYKEYTKDYYNSVVSKYLKLDKMLSDNTVIHLVEKIPLEGLLRITDTSIQEIATVAVKDIISDEDFQFLMEECMHPNIIEEIVPSDLSQSISSKSELDNYYINLIMSNLKNALPYEIEKRNEKIRIAKAEEKENEEKQLRINNQKKSQLLILRICMCIAFVIPVIIHCLLVYNWEKSIEQDTLSMVKSNYIRESDKTKSRVNENNISDDISISNISFYENEYGTIYVSPKISLNSNNTKVWDTSLNLILYDLTGMDYEWKSLPFYIALSGHMEYKYSAVVYMNGDDTTSTSNLNEVTKTYKIDTFNPYINKTRIIMYLIFCAIIIVIYNKLKKRIPFTRLFKQVNQS